MKFYLLINSKLLISTVFFLLSLAECEIFNANEYENANISWHFHIYQQGKFQAKLTELSSKKCFTTSGPKFLTFSVSARLSSLEDMRRPAKHRESHKMFFL